MSEHKWRGSNAGMICVRCWRLKKDCESTTCDGKDLVFGGRRP